MEALQHGTSMVGAPCLVCANHRNLRRAVELHNSSSQAFQLKACGESKLRVRASSSIAKSSAVLAMSNFHAQSLQVLYDAQMVHHISNSKLAVGHTQADHNMKVQQRQHAALDYAVPDFIPPFTYKSNLGVEEANKAAVKWALHHFESILSPENFQKLIYGAKFHHLAGAIYTDAPISRLEFAIEFLTWLYVLDDESLLQRSSVQDLVQFQLEIQLVIMSGFPQDKSPQDNLEKCVSIKLGNEFAKDFVDNVLTQATGKDLLGTGYGDPLSPIASAFQDLWIRAISVMPEGWSLRFAKVLQRDVFANFLESLNLHHNICPSVSAYTQERRSNGIVIPPIVLQEFLQDVFLPDSIFDSLPMQRLIDATADVICWDNDIWSFPKELAAGEEANLVFLTSKEEGCSYNEAAEIVTKMMINKCKEMELAAIDLRKYCKIQELTTSQKAAIEHYISCCKHGVSGAHTFYSRSSRYKNSS